MSDLKCFAIAFALAGLGGGESIGTSLVEIGERVRNPLQSDVSAPQSTALHLKVRQVTPATPKIGCGHSSIRSSLPRPQLGQLERCSSGNGMAAARCVSLIILISCYASARVERIAGNQAELATASA